MNFIAPLVLSILIHLGIVISFSNIFSINFDQFNIESRKPIAAYLILEQPKIKKIETTNLSGTEQFCTLQKLQDRQ